MSKNIDDMPDDKAAEGSDNEEEVRNQDWAYYFMPA